METVPAHPFATGKTGQHDLHRRVDEKGALRDQAADGEPRHRPQPFEIRPVAVALIRQRRVEVAIGDDDPAGCERRTNDLPDELGPRRGEEERLSLGRERSLARVQDDLTDALPGGRTAGLAGVHNRPPAGFQRFGETGRLQRFAETFTALERKEDPGHLKIWTRRNGSCPVLRELRFARSTSSCCSLRTYAFCGESSTSFSAPLL